MGDDTAARPDRRTLLKQAAAAGALAWTAPVIIGSFASPAAAQSACSSCLRFGFVASGDACTLSTSTDDYPPKNGGVDCEATPCANTTDINKGRSFASLCFTITGACDFTAGGQAHAQLQTACTPTGCTTAPQFLAASMSWFTASGTSCTKAPPADGQNPGIATFNASDVIFNIPTNAKSQKSGAFQFVICCA